MENQSPVPKKWYDNKAVVIICCFFCFPVGLYALWMNQQIAKGWKIGVTIFFALMVIGVSRNDKNKTEAQPTESKVETAKAEPPKEDAVLYSASDLYSEYHANEVRADNKFKGKTVYVQGVITEIEKDAFDNVIVKLSIGDQYSFDDIHCQMNDANIAASLEKGQTVTIRGKCTGMILGSVILNKCDVQ